MVCFQGRPKLTSGEVLNFSNYVPTKAADRGAMVSPRISTKHTYLPFLRSVAHNVAINELRNLGLYPVKTRVTKKNPYSVFNYNSVLYAYWVFYCNAEGYNRHHAIARKVLLYLFFGKPHFKGMS